MTVTVPRLMPADRAAGGSQVWAAMRAEVTMQWRRLGFWLAFGAAFALLLLLTLQAVIFLRNPPPESIYTQRGYTALDLENLVVVGSTTYGVIFFGFLAGLIVVDRVQRDRQLGMLELQRATTQGWGRYTLGKFFGNYLAVLLPVFLAYLVCALVALAFGWPATIVTKFALVWLLVFAPSCFFAVCISLMLASFLPVRVVQIIFALLWIGFNTGLGWQELAYSIFSTSGLYVYPIVVPLPPMDYTMPGFQTSPTLALLNVIALFLAGLVAIAITYFGLTLQHRRLEQA